MGRCVARGPVRVLVAAHFFEQGRGRGLPVVVGHRFWHVNVGLLHPIRVSGQVCARGTDACKLVRALLDCISRQLRLDSSGQ